MLTRFNTLESEQVSDRVFRFVISDESVDRYGTVIKVNGWQLDNYAKNGIVAYQHITGAANPDFIVGKGRAWVEGDRLMGEVEFEPEGQNPIADKLINKLKFGSIKSTSVGFNPLDWSKGDPAKGEDKNTLYFRSSDLLEFSIVNIPANPNAVAVQKSYEEFISMAKDEEGLVMEQPADETNETPPTPNNKHRDRYMTLRLQSLSI